ncbi:ABC transporter permease [Phaeocystidibacter luteus]|nr:ABC transporter permease [Phaeocystidibacter luteus]
MSFLRSTISKLGQAIGVLFGVATLIFILFNVLSGDPARMMMDQREDEEVLAAIRAKYGLDQSLGVQYLYYLNDLSPISWHSDNADDYTNYGNHNYVGAKLFGVGDGDLYLKRPYLRESMQQQGRSVGDVIGETLPNTAVLAVSSILIAILLGIFIGVVSALKKDSFFDRFWTVVGTLGMSLPSFFSAILIAWLFGFVLSEYTGLSMTGSLYEVDDYGTGRYLALDNLILPALTLGIRPLGVIIQLTRSSVLETMGQDYIRTARAKGLSTFQIVRRHVLRNSMNPVVTAVSGWFASMLAGAVFVEYIFGWNGLGRQIVDALNQKDLPVVMGAVLTIAALFVVINVLVDLIYRWLDPRIRSSHS